MHSSRRDFLKAAGLGTAGVILTGCLPSSSQPNRKNNPAHQPNVILVMTDDQGYGDITCHGNDIIKTPTLDRLHAQSVRLTNFHVDPCCSPTRAALLTGRYSSRTGVWHTVGGRSLIRRNEQTIADVFGASGYRTAIFGKWHLGDNYPFRPQDRGFDETLIHGGGALGNVPDYWGNDYFDDTYFRNGKPEKFTGYCTDIWFDEAIKFLRANRSRPFFCYLSVNVPHGPLRVDEKYVEPYLSKTSPDIAKYFGMIANFDENMDHLLKEVKALGLERDTIFIFMSDNGTCPWVGGIRVDEDGFVTEGYNAGMRGGKIWEYEGGHRVPFYIRWPAEGIEGGRDIDRLTAHLDLFPTLIDCCNLKKPKGPKLDGISLRPLLTDPAATIPDRTIFVHNQRVDYPQKWKNCQAMTQKWRLVNGTDLYDITADPGQVRNLANIYPKVVKKLRAEYEKWWKSISTDFDLYNEIVIGADQQNPTTLWPHDWHGKDFWAQSQVKRANECNGIWVIEVAKDGEYEVELRRWPKELDMPITAAIPNAKALPITKARLKVGNIEKSVKVAEEDVAATFTVHLKAGSTCLQTWFIEEKTGTERGAYYTYITRTGPANKTLKKKYKPTKPKDALKT